MSIFSERKVGLGVFFAVLIDFFFFLYYNIRTIKYILLEIKELLWDIPILFAQSLE